MVKKRAREKRKANKTLSGGNVIELKQCLFSYGMCIQNTIQKNILHEQAFSLTMTARLCLLDMVHSMLHKYKIHVLISPNLLKPHQEKELQSTW